MLRAKVLTFIIILLAVHLIALMPQSGHTALNLRRITRTSEETINLNPSLSGDGRHVAFESTEDLAHAGSGLGFHAFTSTLETESVTFSEIARTRMVTPGISRDGSAIVLSSAENLTGENPDRNFEIFLKIGTQIRQITRSSPDSTATRTEDGSFQPSITDDGYFVVFSSNRNLAGNNSDLNFEVFLFETTTETLSQLTNTNGIVGSLDAKISGDGSQVVFILDDGASPQVVRSLVLYDCSSRQARTIVDHSPGLALTYGRAISDNGLRVVYSSETVQHQSQVFVFDSRTNSARQITTLGTRAADVSLNPTISGDGKRVALATRRKVLATSDGGVELYVFDLPTAQLTQLTDAPSSATAEVVSSLNDDGSLVAFSFPRVLSDSASSSEAANNNEIYLATIPARPAFGTVTIRNGASLGNEPAVPPTLPRGGIVIARGNALANQSLHGKRSLDASFPVSLGGTVVTINGLEAHLFYVSPAEVSFVIPNEISPGPAEIVITNADGFQSRASVTVSSAAPGIFTHNGDGRGRGVILNADNLAAEGFDPTNGRLRLDIFATGIRNATSVSVSIAGQNAPVESIVSSADLPGLEEIHVLVPATLGGTGEVGVTIDADGRRSNSVTLLLGGSSLRDVVINELLADPPDGFAGDANHDGVRNAADDEFVELINATTRDLDLTAYQLQSRTSTGTTDVVRHRFAAGTILSAGTALVVFGGGNPGTSDPVFAGAKILKASSGGLSLANGGGVVTLRDATGSAVTFVAYGGTTGLQGDANQSLTRFPDIVGTLILHRLASVMAQRAYSPGSRVNGEPFVATPAISNIIIIPDSISLFPGEQVQFIARAIDERGDQLNGVIFNWHSSRPSVATIDQTGVARAFGSGEALVTALARSVTSLPAVLTVSQPAPSPSPTASPTPPPTPTPTPTPTPGPSPSPGPTPSPSPAIPPGVVISEFRSRGPNGASDEFIEIYNVTDSPASIGGWKIKASSNSGSVTTRATIANGTIVPGHGHFLVTNSSGYSGNVTGDQTYSSGIADDGGIAVTTANDLIVDAVGMSSGSAFREGPALGPQSNNSNQSYERKPGGTAGSGQDTNDNAADFRTISPSDPQNLSSNPTPVGSPSPSPTPSPTVTPSPSPTPSPGPSPTPSPSPSPSGSPMPTVVISQVYGGGGNSGAPFRNDFIELFNSGTVPVSLSGWSVQYASASSSTWAVTVLTSGTLAPGQYYLVQEASGGSVGQTLPSADATGSINLASMAGKVALVNTATPLAGACPTPTAIIDLVGYGAANCFEGTGPAPALSNIIAAQRNASGCVDSQNNVNDFAASSPTPRNSGSSLNLCMTARFEEGFSHVDLRVWMVRLLWSLTAPAV